MHLRSDLPLTQFNYPNKFSLHRNMLVNRLLSLKPLLLQASVWISDSEHFLKTTRDGAKRCTTEEEVVDLLDMLEGFVKPGLNKQEARLKKVAELSAKLTMDEPRYKAKDLMEKQKEISTKFDLMDSDLFRLAERLRERKQRGLPPKVQLHYFRL